MVNKSGNKVQIIINIDKKLSLDTIAEALGISLNELLIEIESIVNSGMKINIDYYINEVIEEDAIDELFEYFSTSESEQVQDAIDEWTNDGTYSEEEVRLVRIKFLSEKAN